MLKAIARRSALVLSLTILAAPMGNIYAQITPTPSAVTGTDPQPTGESVSSGSTTSVIVLLYTLFSVVVS